MVDGVVDHHVVDGVVTHHVVDGVVDSLHHLLFPLSFAVAGSPRTIVNVIHVHRPEMSNAFHV